MYIQNQKDTDLINQYENALQKLKQEYTLMYKENQELKKNSSRNETISAKCFINH